MRTSVAAPSAVLAAAAVVLAAACGGGGGEAAIPPFWLRCGIVVADFDGDGLNDLFVNDGPVVLLQRAAAPGTFDPPRALR